MPFDFNDECLIIWDKFKKELISAPISMHQIGQNRLRSYVTLWILPLALS